MPPPHSGGILTTTKEIHYGKSNWKISRERSWDHCNRSPLPGEDIEG